MLKIKIDHIKELQTEISRMQVENHNIMTDHNLLSQELKAKQSQIWETIKVKLQTEKLNQSLKTKIQESLQKEPFNFEHFPNLVNISPAPSPDSIKISAISDSEIQSQDMDSYQIALQNKKTIKSRPKSKQLAKADQKNQVKFQARFDTSKIRSTKMTQLKIKKGNFKDMLSPNIGQNHDIQSSLIDQSDAQSFHEQPLNKMNTSDLTGLNSTKSNHSRNYRKSGTNYNTYSPQKAGRKNLLDLPTGTGFNHKKLNLQVQQIKEQNDDDLTPRERTETQRH